jgi:hypothetical protein
MLELLSRALLPRLSLSEAIQHWGSIAHQLAEAPRKRTRQSARLKDILC